jgi:hypothetical protein
VNEFHLFLGTFLQLAPLQLCQILSKSLYIHRPLPCSVHSRCRSLIQSRRLIVQPLIRSLLRLGVQLRRVRAEHLARAPCLGGAAPFT